MTDAWTISLADIWWPFVTLAVAGCIVVWFRPWMLLLVIVACFLLAWRVMQRLPDPGFVESLTDPATRAVAASFWRHTYDAIETAVFGPSAVGFIRWLQTKRLPHITSSS